MIKGNVSHIEVVDSKVGFVIRRKMGGCSVVMNISCPIPGLEGVFLWLQGCICIKHDIYEHRAIAFFMYSE